MATFKFTIDRIAELTCDPGKTVVYHYDSDAPGLGIRVTASGVKSYIFQSYIHHKQFRMTIGDVSAWRLDAPARSSDNSARKEARRLQTLCDAGIDPRQEKADRKAEVDLRKAAAVARKLEEQRQQVTLGDVWPTYIDARHSKWGERHLQDHYKIAQQGGEPVRRGTGVTKPGPLASLLPLKLSELTQARVASWAEKESQRLALLVSH
ncbi:Arm DNA-binding domain-containing protein [Chromobacterium haemolyticum]|nr:Arm DNA-binding domain-containing protein [Chromobacterium haemolyticum]